MTWTIQNNQVIEAMSKPKPYFIDNEYQRSFESLSIKISAVSVFLEANHHSIITHLITLDKKTLK